MDKPIYTQQIIRNLVNRINSVIVRLENSLKQAPEGTIEFKFHKGKVRFYRHLKGEPDKYLGKDKDAVIKALIQKRLDLEMLKVSQKEKKALEGALESIGIESREKVWAQFPGVLKGYVKVDESVNDGYIKSWQSQWPLAKEDKEHKFKTSRGDYVRSKSEHIIAEILYKMGVPYWYEKPIVFEHGLFIYTPDFQVMNPKTYKEYYWEHFGMIDNKKYCNDMKGKLEIYAEYGIFPGKNLIMTFESADKPLNVENVERQIKEYLLN